MTFSEENVSGAQISPTIQWCCYGISMQLLCGVLNGFYAVDTMVLRWCCQGVAM